MKFLIVSLICFTAFSVRAATFDFESNTTGLEATNLPSLGGKTATQTVDDETLQITLVSDHPYSYVFAETSNNMNGSEALAGGVNVAETSFTFSLVSGNSFDLTSINLGELFGSNETLTFTSSKGTTSYALNASTLNATFNVSGDINASNFQEITSFAITASDNSMSLGLDDIVLDNISAVQDSDGDLTAASTVSEPIQVTTTIDTAGEAVDVFDFTLSDGGATDGLTLDVTQIVVNITGTSNDTQRGSVTWRLNGPDASNVQGIYNGGSDTITFSGLSISVADGDTEVYTLNAYYNDNTSVTDGTTYILNLDGDTDLTIDANGTQMGSTSAVSNSSGGAFEVDASALVFTTQPGGSVSGSTLTSQPVVTAQDAFGNTDADFAETITLSETSPGSVSGDIDVTAVNGVSTFIDVSYNATSDQQSFALTANDEDGTGSDLPQVDSNSISSDVVATQLVFDTQPSPLSLDSGVATTFTIAPVLSARNINNVLDTDYVGNITLGEVNGAGIALMTRAGDSDGSPTTVTIASSSGIADFSGLQINYIAIADSESFNLRAISSGLTSADSVQLQASDNAPPQVTSVDVPAGGTYINADDLDFTVNFDEAIQVDTTSGIPRLELSIGSDTQYAMYQSGSGTTALLFRYTVQPGDEDSNGISLDALDPNSGVLEDSADNDADTTLNNVGNLSSVLVDTIAPILTEVTPVVTPARDRTPDVTISTSEAGDLEVGGSCGSNDEGSVGQGTQTITLRQPDNATRLDEGTYSDCTVTVTDSNGNASSALILSAFTIDRTDPILEALAPLDNATGVSSTTILTMDFDENIVLGSGNIDIRRLSNDNLLARIDTTSNAGQLSINNDVLEINPTVDLPENAELYVEIDDATIFDLAGNDYEGISSSSAWNFTITGIPPVITEVTIPNITHRVGETVTATISVSSDTEDYSTVNSGTVGTVNGFALTNFSKVNDTTYTASFEITDGGTDIAASNDVAVSVSINDSAGNISNTYATPISQANDAIFANLPNIALSTTINEIAEDGGVVSLTATISNSLNNLWPEPILVNLVYSGTATANIDYQKTDNITINEGSNSGSTVVTAIDDLFYDATAAETIMIDIESASAGQGNNEQVAISINDDETAPLVNLMVGSNTISEAGGSSSITAIIDTPTFENVVVSLAYSGTALGNNEDYQTPSTNIVIESGTTAANAQTGIVALDNEESVGSRTIIIDIADVTGGGANELGAQQQTITISEDDNFAPTITSTPLTTVDEDSLYFYEVTADDIDITDILILSAPVLPVWLDFNDLTGELSGTPTNDHVGSHLITLRVNDGSVDVEQSFTIEVGNTNDPPTITGQPLLRAVEGVPYSFSVIGADEDVGDILTFGLTNQPAWLTVNAEGVISGTPSATDIGVASGIEVAVNDGFISATLPIFSIFVDSDQDGDGIGDSSDTDTDGDGMSDDFEIANSLDPFDASDAESDLDGDGISNLQEFIDNTNPTIDDYGPVITFEDPVVIDSIGLLTPMPDSLATAVDATDGAVTVTHDLESELLSPGRYNISWSASDSFGNETTEIQTLDVRPLSNWQVDQETGENNMLTVTLFLNGEAPNYPVEASYSLSGTAENPSDHNALSGSLTIDEGRSGSIAVSIVDDAVNEEDETILFTLESITNAVMGTKTTHQITISEFNHAPSISLSAALEETPDTPSSIFASDDGAVIITAIIVDVDTGDNHQFEWSDSNGFNGSASGNTYRFDPNIAGPGVHQLTVTTSDDATVPLSGTAVITLTILEEALELSNISDSDGDGMIDSSEGFGDSDGDNVPDFADATAEKNLLALFPIGGEPSDGAWFVETQPGLNLQLNIFSSGSGEYSPLLDSNDIVDANQGDRSDSGFIYDGGLFDFVVSSIAVPGETVFVVLPQLQPIPELAIYRKEVNGQWFNFVEDANNLISSAPGELGICPPPGSTDYEPGLSEGYYCVQIGIEDGGVNDADGKKDGTILDPGGVAISTPLKVRTSGGALLWLTLAAMALLLVSSLIKLAFAHIIKRAN